MPLRKPRRQTLQELAYPPVPKIGGTDLRADEKILGIDDWEVGDRSGRYPTPQALSLLGTSDAGSRWGSSSVAGSSAAGWPTKGSHVGSQLTSGPSSPQKSSSAFGSPQKSSVSFPSTPVTHQVKRKAPPSLDPGSSSSAVSSAVSSSLSKTTTTSKISSSIPSTASSAPKLSIDGTVRPGDIVPPNWSPLTPTPAREKRTSQPLPPPTSYQPLSVPPLNVHSRSRSHSQSLVSAPSLPTIAASPKPNLLDTPHAKLTAPSQSSVVVSTLLSAKTEPVPLETSAPTSTPTSPLRPIKKAVLQPPSPSQTTPKSASPNHTNSSKTSSVSFQPPSTTVPLPQPQTSSSANVPRFLQVPNTSAYGFTPPPAPASAPASTLLGSASASQLSVHSQGRTASRTLPKPPGPAAALPAAASLVLSTTRAAPASAPVSPTTAPQASINTWRSGILTSGPGGWGMSVGTQQQAQAPQPLHKPQFQSQILSQAQAGLDLASSVPQDRYQPAPLPTRAQYQPSAPQAQPLPPPVAYMASPVTYAPLPPTQSASAMPIQIATTLGGYASNGSANPGNISPIAGDSRTNGPGKPKLTRKLTKPKGLQPSLNLAASVPRVIQSNGEAFVSAQRALVGTHRPAQERIIWGLPLNRDPRVGQAVGKIEGIKDMLVTFGAEQFVKQKMKGAVMCNVDYHPPDRPNELAFDWITFKDAQKSLEPVLQKAIVSTDPATSVLVIIFLLSSSLNSLAIWRKSIAIAPGQLSRQLMYEVERVKRETVSLAKEMVIKVCEDEESAVNREAAKDTESPQGGTTSLSRNHSASSRFRVLFKSSREISGEEPPSSFK